MTDETLERIESELILDITARATNTDRYKEVTLGQWQLRFEVDGKDKKHILIVRNDIGRAKNLNRVFLDTLEIKPNMVEK